MEKVIITQDKELIKNILNDAMGFVSQKIDCPIKACEGQISVLPAQKNKNCALICNKCRRAVVLNEIKC